MGKFSMSHPLNKESAVEKLESLSQASATEAAAPSPEKEQCELLHCDGHKVDLTPYIKKEDIKDYSSLFQNYDERMLLLNNKYDILLNDHKEANKALDNFSDRMNRFSNKVNDISNKIDENSHMIDSNMNDFHDKVKSNFDIISKDLELINNKLEAKQNKFEKYMPVIQVMVAVLLSILIIKSF